MGEDGAHPGEGTTAKIPRTHEGADAASDDDSPADKFKPGIKFKLT